MYVAKYSAPPAGTVTAAPVDVQHPTAIEPGVFASRWPWKSLNGSSLTVVSFGGFGSGFALGAASAAGVKATASANAAIATNVLFMVLLLPLRLAVQEQLRLEHECVGCGRSDEPRRLVAHLQDEGAELVGPYLRNAVEVLLELCAGVVPADRAGTAVVREQGLQPVERGCEREPGCH